MRFFHLVTVLTLTALAGCTDGDGTTKDDTDGGDTDAAATDDASADTDAVDTDVEEPVGWAAAAVGTWTPTAEQDACGVDMELGLVGTAVMDSPNEVTLTMTEAGSLQTMTFACTFSDATHYTCASVSINGGDVTTCLYQTSLGGVAGTVIGDVGTISVTVNQNAVGQYCPPVQACTGTATATATIGD